MNGVARTRPHGCSRAATTTLWCAMTARRCWWRQASSCGGWESYWTTTTTPWPSTMPWTPSTFTPLRSPSCCPLCPLSWSGTSQSWYSRGSPSPTLSMAWPQICRSSSRWACAGKSRHTWPGWRPATEKGSGMAEQRRPLKGPIGPGDWKVDGSWKTLPVGLSLGLSSPLRADQ